MRAARIPGSPLATKKSPQDLVAFSLQWLKSEQRHSSHALDCQLSQSKASSSRFERLYPLNRAVGPLGLNVPVAGASNN